MIRINLDHLIAPELGAPNFDEPGVLRYDTDCPHCNSALTTRFESPAAARTAANALLAWANTVDSLDLAVDEAIEDARFPAAEEPPYL